MTAGRRVELGLRLLDHQIVDRDGALAGNVDDLELTSSHDGRYLYVTAILSGPGVVWERMGARRLGRWLQRAHASLKGDARARIPFTQVQDINAHITVAAAADELGNHDTEQWTRDHLITRIPGSRHEPPP